MTQNSSDLRFQHLHHWLQQHYHSSSFELTPITNDASFRRYFRVTHQGQSAMAMDAPPAHENLVTFIHKAQIFHNLQIQVPKILAYNLDQGFLLMSDLGNDLYLQIATSENFAALYNLAIATLQRIQTYVPQTAHALPDYDEALLLRELQLFPTWYLTQNNFSPDQDALDKIFKLLIDSALKQPRVLVHRDYHSRNLLLLPHQQLGVVDFQDAVIGPITYDLVSLLRDCYLAWPENAVENLVKQFYQDANLKNVATEEFLRWFDWMGLQRHLKVLGLFVRLHKRDQKPAYLKDLPRVLNYVRAISNKYSEFTVLQDLLAR